MDSLHTSLATTTPTGLTLDTLPDDILFEVVALCRSDPRRLVPQIFSAVRALSLVNRHFHALVVLFLRRDKTFLTVRSFCDAVKWYKTAKGRSKAQALRTVSVGRPRSSYRTTDNIVRGSLPFPNLTTFACYEHTVSRYILKALKRLGNLRTLHLALHVLDRWILDFSMFPKLETLRLGVINALRSRDPLPLSLSFAANSALTTLAIQNTRDDFWEWPSMHFPHLFPHLTFPHLRVLNLTDMPYTPDIYYNFVRRHSTLREVHVSILEIARPEQEWLHFEGLVELIQGTTSLHASTTRKQILSNGPTVKFDELRHLEPSSLRGALFHSFAFSRTPAHRDPPSSTVSKEPYYITGLALNLEADHDNPEEGPHMSLPVFINSARDYLLHVQELRLCTQERPSRTVDRHDFIEEMTVMANALRGLNHLRRLTFGWPIDPDGWRWNADDDPGEPIGNELKGLNALAIFGNSIWHRPLAPEEIRINHVFTNESFADFKASLRTLLDEEVDDYDPDVVMRAWESRNTRHAARGMRILAEACPLLEEIEWESPRWVTYMVTNWVWRVCRDQNGRVRLLSPQKLTWTGSARGEPHYNEDLLVGQELEYSRWERDMLDNRASI